MKILVTGGAGYIGSICTEALLEKNCEVVVIDNLTEGHAGAVSSGAIFYEGDIGDAGILEKIFQCHHIDVVMHFAGETLIGISMSHPRDFFENNVVNGLNLINVMKKYDCRKIIFSSTAAIFGNPEYVPIDEDHPKRPINAYGESKLMFEKILDWYHSAYGFQFNCFRYFNAAGASERLGEAHRRETHLIPLVFRKAINAEEKFHIFGSDYNTKDGTCVRDYLHVIDIAQAHILGLENLASHPCAKYNLGNGVGYTNIEVLKTIENISGRKIAYEFGGRRAGDPDTLIASSRNAQIDLGWEPKYTSLDSIIGSAWDWYSKHPNGYET